MSNEMDLKAFVGLVFLAIAVNCQYGQYNVSHLISTTQHLQDLERGGVGDVHDGKYQNIYPELGMSENHLGDVKVNQSIPHPLPPRPKNVSTISDEELKKFINKTLHSMPSGICVKEVPTASLTSNVHARGNGSDPSLSRIQTCCEGYQRHENVYRKCEPICSDGCLNGICTSPETCTCLPNYVLNEFGKCVVRCPVGCSNGVCNPDSTCNCNPGYIQDVSRKFCIPKCDRKCLNGQCVKPNYCMCNKGYVVDTNDQYRCVPTCSPPCENGICSGPNMCLCYAGYVKDRRSKTNHKCIKQ